MTTITIDDVMREARSLAPHRRNPSADLGAGIEQSVYTDAGGCHCIIGEIGTRLGLAMPAWGDVDNGSAWGQMAHARNLDVDAWATWALAMLQSHADYGDTWGEAVKAVDAWLADCGGAT